MPNPKQFKKHKDYLKWYKDYREKNREKIRAYNREYNKIYRKKNGYGNEDVWKDNNREKVLVEKLTQLAIKTGKLNRGNCVICGKKNTHAHHSDYSKPLDVIWLCPLHHKGLHLSGLSAEEYIKVIHTKLLTNKNKKSKV